MWATLNQDVKEESEVPVLREEEEEKEASSLEFNHKKNPPLHFYPESKIPPKSSSSVLFPERKERQRNRKRGGFKTSLSPSVLSFLSGFSFTVEASRGRC
ncbi:hypothetical protein OYC64_011300 [Pagothenia borchgrevinki]|uniref:Uncharacterized protein n=1 Tax=Pagothenia borchgrevinki TaxID=8213 RepID=A0ABD2GZE5_PAGBO